MFFFSNKTKDIFKRFMKHDLTENRMMFGYPNPGIYKKCSWSSKWFFGPSVMALNNFGKK